MDSFPILTKTDLSVISRPVLFLFFGPVLDQTIYVNCFPLVLPCIYGHSDPFFFVFWIMSSYNTLLSNSRLGDLLFFLPAFFRDPRPVPSVSHFVCKVCLLRVGTTACALHIFVRASLLCSLVWSEFRRAQFSIA